MLNKNTDQFYALTKKYFKLYLGIAISVFLFILFFQPFSIENFNFENKLLIIAGFGLITFIFLIITQVIFQKVLIQDESETPKTSILNTLYFSSLTLFNSLAFIFYLNYVVQIQPTYETVVKVILICIAPPAAIYLKNKLSSNQSMLKQIKHENILLQKKLKKFAGNYANHIVEIFSDNDSDNFRIKVSEILFVKSADNYVEIAFVDGSEVKKKLIRNTLKNVEEQLQKFNYFIRTHRTSIVNMQYIEKLQKSFSKHWLSLKQTKETIPVSRQYLLAVKDLF